MFDGMLNIYKEQGFTSHDVVAKLRGILRQKKIGHTGTLDPMATGVLPVCLGKGTKLCNMITDHNKEYTAEMILGITTDTQDTSGQILSDIGLTADDEWIKDNSDRISEVIKSFIGTFEQIPPMYSAKKVNGEKLYDLARKGITVERKGTVITVYDIKINSICVKDLRPCINITVSCSKGTYIRTLCADIGEKFGTGATMSALLRNRVGEFKLEDALTLSEVEQLVKDDKVSERILSLEEMLSEYTPVYLTPEGSRFAHNGNPLNDNNFTQVPSSEGQRFRVYDSDGCFIALYDRAEKTGEYKPFKMFL